MDSLSILENITIVEAFPIVDLSSAANNGDWVSLKNYNRCLVMFAASAGAAGEAPTITFAQATDVSGTGNKALTISATGYYKSAATDLSGTGQFSTSAISAASTFQADTTGSRDKLWCVEIRAAMLDLANSFDCFRVTIADVGATAQLGGCWYLLGDPRDPSAPDKMLSAIVD